MRPVIALLLVVLGLAGCANGAGGGPFAARRAPSPPAGGDAGVVRSWADTLRRGDVDGAARLFAVPARVENGPPGVLELTSRDEIRAFNRALPCGAKVEETTLHHGYVIARFKLVDRSGPGAARPCQGKGAEAATAFKIVAGHITEWRRVPTPSEDTPPAATNQS